MMTEITNEILIGWGSLSFIISGIAQAFNRNGLLWWLLGAIFGPFALFVLVILGKVASHSD